MLEGFARYKVLGEAYPAVVAGVDGSVVDGTLICGLSETQMLALDEYEGAEYAKEDVVVVCNGRFVQCAVYLWIGGTHRLSPDAWTLDKHSLDLFLATI